MGEREKKIDLRLAGILRHERHFLWKSAEIWAMFLACTKYSTFRKDKGSNMFFWTAQGTFSFVCSSYLQSLDMDFCSLDFGIMDVNMAGLTEIGFIPEKIWL
jgi:hypothetical protein